MVSLNKRFAQKALQSLQDNSPKYVKAINIAATPQGVHRAPNTSALKESAPNNLFEKGGVGKLVRKTSFANPMGLVMAFSGATLQGVFCTTDISS